MSESLFSKRSSLNIGNIPASAEELSQKYEKIFQQYSRLNAQHAVLKKAVIKEQSTKMALQGDVREKEKELRKLQEYLDLLSFHNERLTKHIQSIQEIDQKGNHFSLLNGSTKKELEKSTQALDAASLDLEHKILANERLHKELAERSVEFTDSINSLIGQIKDLEERVKNLTIENDELLRQPDQSKTQKSLQATINLERLEQEHKDNERHKSYILSEFCCLCTILLAKIEDSENISLKEVLDKIDCSLKDLEDQAEKYIKSVDGNYSEIKLSLLPEKVAEKLNISRKTWKKELENMCLEIGERKKEIEDILGNNQQRQTNALQIQLQQLNEKYNEEKKQFDEICIEKTKQIDIKYENELKEQTLAIENNMVKIKQLKSVNNNLEEENIKLVQNIDNIKKNILSEVDKETQTEKNNGRNKQEIYPEESSVYTGVDVVLSQNTKEDVEKEIAEREAMKREVEENEVLEREAAEKETAEKEKNIFMMKVFYEQQIKDITVKLQRTDTRVLDFADRYRKSRGNLESKEKNEKSMASEIERLSKEVKHVQDLLSTTESNYQNQIDTLTEFIASMKSH